MIDRNLSTPTVNVDALIQRLVALGKAAKAGSNATDNCGHATRFLLEYFKRLLDGEVINEVEPLRTDSSEGSARMFGSHGLSMVKMEDNLFAYYTQQALTVASERNDEGFAAQGLEGIVPPPVSIKIEMENNRSVPFTDLTTNRTYNYQANLQNLNAELMQRAKSKKGIMYGGLSLFPWPADRHDAHVIFFCATEAQVYFIDLMLYQGIEQVGNPLFYALQEAKFPNGLRAYAFNSEYVVMNWAHIELPLLTYQSVIFYLPSETRLLSHVKSESVISSTTNTTSTTAITEALRMNSMQNQFQSLSVNNNQAMNEVVERSTKDPNKFKNVKENNKRELYFQIDSGCTVQHMKNMSKDERQVRIEKGALRECVELMPNYIEKIFLGLASAEAVKGIPKRYTSVTALSLATRSGAFAALQENIQEVIFEVRPNVEVAIEFEAFATMPLSVEKLICIDLTEEQLQKVNQHLSRHVELYACNNGVKKEITRILTNENAVVQRRKKHKVDHSPVMTSVNITPTPFSGPPDFRFSPVSTRVVPPPTLFHHVPGFSFNPTNPAPPTFFSNDTRDEDIFKLDL